MDALRQSNGQFLLSISPSEAKEIAHYVDNFRHWEMIASRENVEPMMFMQQFGRDCTYALEQFPTINFAIETGKVPLTKEQVFYLGNFIKACVETDKSLSFINRTVWKMAWKTLHNRIV